MKCPSCDRAIEPGQRFCTGCGRSLAGITDVPGADRTPVAPAPVTADVAETNDWAEPDWAPTGSLPTQAIVLTSQLPATEPVSEVATVPQHGDFTEPAIQTPYDVGADATSVIPAGYEPEPVGYTTEMPVGHVDPYNPYDPYAALVEPHAHRFRLTAVMLIGIAAGILTLVSMFSTVLTITSSGTITIGDDAPATFRTGTWIVDDLADNLSVAGLIAAVMMVIGGVASGFGWKWGGGLAGGAGLGFAGIAALAIGLAQFPIDAAHDFARIPSAQPFTLSITRDLGYWLLVGVAALGIVLFFASLNDAFADRRAGLNPWIAALGALAVVITVVGPLIPENQAVFSDNWYIIDAPGEPAPMLLAGRLIQLALMLVAGVIGFLSVRRWGLGVVTGASLPFLWLGVSTLFDLTDRPVGPAFRNVGATEMSVHGVTIIGMSALASMLVLGAIAAYEQGIRERAARQRR
jgi:hypothetical protein